MKMNKRKTWIKQFQEINNLMEDQLDKWKTIDEIRKTYDDFIKNLKQLKDMQPDLDKDLSPLTKEFDEKRELLITKIFPVVNILAVYSSDNNLKKGISNLIINREELGHLKRRKLLDFANHMQKTLEKYFPGSGHPDGELSHYGLTPIMVDEFSTALAKYDHALQLSKDLLRNRKKSEKTSNRLLKANRKILEERLDRLMTVFSVTHPSFYQDYAGIREHMKDPVQG
jgi:DNA repair exonuclease SbcCD ATPase subunit